MTRETKIGLLVGLGFIVVFAVLLSHTGSVPPQGDGLPMASRESGLQDTLVGRAQPGVGVSLTGRSGTPHGVRETTEGGSPSGVGLVSSGIEAVRGPLNRLAQGLPRPSALGPSPTEWTATDGQDGSGERQVSLPRSSSGALTAIDRRVAPALPARPIEIAPPAPTAPVPAPQMSPSPELKPERSPSLPPTREAVSREYMVQKGETLGEIAKQHYGTANKRAVEFLASTNQMKDVHTIREGQKLVIPALPAELAAIVEPAPSFDVRRVTGDARTVSSEELASRPVRSEGRQAPSLVRREEVASRVASTESPVERRVAPQPGGARTYEVRPGDMLSTIAARELGSAARWPEILKLNQDLDPKRMKPGTKIKLPNGEEKPEGDKRVSA
ncbi:MAG: LysM peptidoglycan-binding domain-containing protein [Phycisphaerae bacterium]|nr:LysM peptidoglycan-binding domain-containing protein [Phycisphaerae bacterium]